MMEIPLQASDVSREVQGMNWGCAVSCVSLECRFRDQHILYRQHGVYVDEPSYLTYWCEIMV